MMQEKPIVLFADDSLEKCRKILEVTKQRKYMDVCVPSSVDESSGYHFIPITFGVFVKQCIFDKKKDKKFKGAK